MLAVGESGMPGIRQAKSRTGAACRRHGRSFRSYAVVDVYPSAEPVRAASWALTAALRNVVDRPETGVILELSRSGPSELGFVIHLNAPNHPECEVLADRFWRAWKGGAHPSSLTPLDAAASAARWPSGRLRNLVEMAPRVDTAPGPPGFAAPAPSHDVAPTPIGPSDSTEPFRGICGLALQHDGLRLRLAVRNATGRRLVAQLIAAAHDEASQLHWELAHVFGPLECLAPTTPEERKAMATAFRSGQPLRWGPGARLMAFDLDGVPPFFPTAPSTPPDDDRGWLPGFSVRVSGPVPIQSTPADGVVHLGRAIAVNGEEVRVDLPHAALDGHVHVMARTGHGKSTLLEHMITSEAQLSARGAGGLCVIDPHGGLIENVLALLPAECADDVLLLDHSETTCPPLVNPLLAATADDRDNRINDVGAALEELFDPGSQGIAGPTFQAWTKQALRLLTSVGSGSICDVPRVYADDAFRSALVERAADNSFAEFFRTQVEPLSRSERAQYDNYVQNKFDQFTGNAIMRRVLGPGRQTWDVARSMAEGQVVLVNLAMSSLTDNAQLLGYLYLMELWAAAIGRGPQGATSPRFTIYLDEFQLFGQTRAARMLAEVRKFNVRVVLAHQHIDQLRADVRAAVLANAGTRIIGRLGGNDAPGLAPYLAPSFSELALMALDEYTWACQLPDPFGHVPFTLLGDDRKPASAEQAERIRSRARALLEQEHGTAAEQDENQRSLAARNTRPSPERPSRAWRAGSRENVG